MNKIILSCLYLSLSSAFGSQYPTDLAGKFSCSRNCEDLTGNKCMPDIAKKCQEECLGDRKRMFDPTGSGAEKTERLKKSVEACISSLKRSNQTQLEKLEGQKKQAEKAHKDTVMQEITTNSLQKIIPQLTENIKNTKKHIVKIEENNVELSRIGYELSKEQKKIKEKIKNAENFIKEYENYYANKVNLKTYRADDADITYFNKLSAALKAVILIDPYGS